MTIHTSGEIDILASALSHTMAELTCYLRMEYASKQNIQSVPKLTPSYRRYCEECADDVLVRATAVIAVVNQGHHGVGTSCGSHGIDLSVHGRV